LLGGTAVALHHVILEKPMYEAITGNFSALAKLIVTDGSTLMIAGDLNILHFSAIALILVFLTVRIAKKKHRNFFKALIARSDPMGNSTAGRFFERHPISALKKCPHCAEQLQLSALICDACDYNFLSRMVGRGQKLLPSPEPMTHEMSDQSFASAGAMR
jgi:type IV secretory pathway VirB3-like protein